MRRTIVVFFLFINSLVWAQVGLISKDTFLQGQSEAVDHLGSEKNQIISPDSARVIVIKHSFLQCYPKGWFFLQKESIMTGKEQLFYALLVTLLIFGLLRFKFERYTLDMFRFYFQSTLRIQHIKEQLTHSVVSGIFYNLLFFLGMSVYLYLLADHFHLSFIIHRYNWLFVVLALLFFIYGFKYLFIQFIGWTFQQKRAAGIYLFIIFLTNKIMGILLLPFCVGIAFGTALLKGYFVTLSISLVISLFVFRFFRAYQALQSEFKIGVFQYLLLLISIELAPLLLIYKLLLQYM
jgi:hypothetical protein